MSIVNQTVPSSNQSPVTEPAQSPAKVQTDELPPEALTARLERERRAGAAAERQSLLAELGFKSDEEVKDFAQKQAREAEARKSELQRQTEERTQLIAKAARADELEKSFALTVANELSKLDDSQRAAVKAIAGDDPVKQNNAIEALRPTWIREATRPTESHAASVPTSAEIGAPSPVTLNPTSPIDIKSLGETWMTKNPYFIGQKIVITNQDRFR